MAAEAAPAGFVGIYAENIDVVPEEVAFALAHQADRGASYVREPFYWDRIEPSAGRFEWAETDALVLEAAKAGVGLLPVLWAPPAYRSSRPAGTDRRGMWPPADFNAFGRFAQEAVARYGPGGSFWCTRQAPALGRPQGKLACREPYRPIRAWQVWNEPDYDHFWPDGPDAGAYLELLRAAQAGIRSADAAAEVVLGGMSIRAVAKGGWLEQLYAAGGRGAFDTIALHPYAASVGGMLAHVRAARRIARRAGDDAPIRITEYGWATGGQSRIGLVVPEHCQAALIHEATRQLIARRGELGLKSITAFMWNDRPGRPELWPYNAGLLRQDGSGKPAAHTFKRAVGGRPLGSSRTAARACPKRNRG